LINPAFGSASAGFSFSILNFYKADCVHPIIIMKTLLGLGLLAFGACVAHSQEYSYYTEPGVFVPSPVVYQAPVVYEASVVYEGPVIYYGPVYYVSAPPEPELFQSNCEQNYSAPSTVIVIGGNHRPYSYSNFGNRPSSVVRLNGGRFGFQ
jgi:hypothetical protein